MELFSYTGNAATGAQVKAFTDATLLPSWMAIETLDGNAYTYYRTEVEVSPGNPYHFDENSDAWGWSLRRFIAIQDYSTGLYQINDDINIDGVNYFGVAFEEVPGPNSAFHCGAYVGDDSPTKAITGVGFEPDVVVIGPKQNYDYFYCRGMTDSIRLGRADGRAVIVTSLDSDGFSIQGANNSGTYYYYWCMRAVPGVCGYTYPHNGNSTPGTLLATGGVAADWAFHRIYLDRDTNHRAYHRSALHLGADCDRIITGNPDSGVMTNMTASGIELGSSSQANQTGWTYANVWFTEQTA